MRHTSRRWLAALLIGLAGSGLPRAAAGQGPTLPDGLRVAAMSPNGPAAAPVTQAQIRFSEPMVALADPEVTDAVAFVRVDPAVPVSFRWADTNVLVVQPTAGRFPHASRITIQVEAGATAVSGRRLEAAVGFTFETPAPRLLSAVALVSDPTAPPTRVRLEFDQPVRDDDAASRITIRIEPHADGVPALTSRARAYLARVDRAALAAHDAWGRSVRAAIGTARALAFTVARVGDAGSRLDVVLAEPPPPGGVLAVDVSGIGSPEGELRRAERERRTVSSGALFALVEGNCGERCEPSAVALLPTRPVDPERFRAALRVADITEPSRPIAVTPTPPGGPRWGLGLEALGFRLAPRRRYAIRVDAGFAAIDGSRLAAPWCAVVDVGLPSSFSTFGSRGTAVWEAALGPRLPLLTRSLVDVRGGAVAIAPEAVVPALRGGARYGGWKGARTIPSTVTRVPGGASGDVREVLVDVARALSPAGTGVVWAAYPGGREAPGVASDVTVSAAPYAPASLIQVTNIGITVRGTAGRLAVLASALDTGRPVAAAEVTVVDEANQVIWRGRTDTDGVADARPSSGRPFAVFARTAADLAFVLVPGAWDRDPAGGVVGVVFTDRGLYRPGETVRARAFVQEPSPAGPRLLPVGTSLSLALVRQGETVATYDAPVDAVGGAEWSIPIPETAATDEEYRLEVARGDPRAYRHRVSAQVLIKAFRAAEFRVGLEASAAHDTPRAVIEAAAVAHDLSEVPLAGAPVAWRITRGPPFELPEALARDQEFQFAAYDPDVEQPFWSGTATAPTIERSGALDADGRHALRAELPDGLVGRGRFTVAAQVRDASSQVVGRDVVVDVPADVYLGVAPDVPAAPDETAIRIVARTPTGDAVVGVDVEVRVGDDDEPDAILRARTAAHPVRVLLPASDSWRRVTLRARGDRRAVMPVTSVFGTGMPGTHADLRPMTLTLDRERYTPGDTARLRIASEWGDALALVTLERGALLHAAAAHLRDGVAVVDLPVGDSPASGLVATVTVVRGRASRCCAGGADDSGRPASTTQTIALPIDRATARLTVALETPAGVVPPGTAARVRVRVRDATGNPARSARVTLWAVDEGVLTPARYQVVDPMTVYDVEAWPLSTADSRDWLLRRRVPDPQSSFVQASTGSAAAGAEPPVGEPVVRRDMRPLAFWFGAVDTDDDGYAAVAPVLPDALTTYRVMAIAADRAGRYGTAEAPLVAARRLMIRPALPRVLTRDDRASLRAIVAARDLAGDGTVVIESLTPDLLAIEARPLPIAVGASARAVATVEAIARRAGTARIRLTATVAGVHDVVERDIPIAEATIRETTAAFGEASGRDAIEAVQPPARIDPTWGGLDVEVASTLLVGLAAAGQYVHEYRYACAEQVASRALLLTLAPDLGPAFSASLGLGDAAAVRARAQAEIEALERYRCGDRYGYWPGDCRLTSPALTAYVLHVLQTAARQGLAVDGAIRKDVADALARLVATPMPGRPAYTDGAASRALAVKVLADGGRRPLRAIDALYAVRAELPVFAQAHLLDAMHTLDPRSPRLADLRRAIANAITPAGATARVVEPSRLDEPWLWSSLDKSTAIVLDVLARTGGLTHENARPLVAGLMQRRKAGLWAGTQGNVWALAGLATYRRTFEAAQAPVTATARLASTSLLRATLSPDAPTHTRAVPAPELRAIVPPGRSARLAIGSGGPGPIFYSTRLRWQRPAAGAPPLAHGIAITRRYEPVAAGTAATAATRFAAGDLVRVTLTVMLPEPRTFLAITDPLPAGIEAVDTTLAGAGHDAAEGREADWGAWRAGFDRLQRHDDRVDLFATSLESGQHTVSYLARATTPGTFFAAPTRAELMYEPEVSGRGAGATITVTPAP